MCSNTEIKDIQSPSLFKIISFISSIFAKLTSLFFNFLFARSTNFLLESYLSPVCLDFHMLSKNDQLHSLSQATLNFFFNYFLKILP